MRAPINKRDTEKWRVKDRWISPDSEWLKFQHNRHWNQFISVNAIAAEVGVGWHTLEGWFLSAGLEIRHHRGGKNNPSWKGGTSRGYGRRTLERSGVQEACAWCGQGRKGAYSMHLHHKDHNKRNNALENLCWLCGHCHRLETALWGLVKQDKIDLVAEGNEMHITFRRK